MPEQQLQYCPDLDLMLPLTRVDEREGEVATRGFEESTEDEEKQHAGVLEMPRSERMRRRSRGAIMQDLLMSVMKEGIKDAGGERHRRCIYGLKTPEWTMPKS